MISIASLPVADRLTGDEKLLILRDGQAMLLACSDAAQASPDLIADAAGSPLDQGRESKRKAMAAVAASRRLRAHARHASVLSGMPGALSLPGVKTEFDNALAAIANRLTALTAAVDAAATLEDLDAITW